jgi:hypothetical protein
MDDLARLKHTCQSYLDGKGSEDDLLNAIAFYLSQTTAEELSKVAWYILKYKED